MNVITRGIRNALRSPIRSGAIVLMLAISIGLILAMLVARSSVTTKIGEVKAATATQVTINPAGIRGGLGGGDPLTVDQVKAITGTSHVASVVSTLTDQLGTTDTSLSPSFELGNFGKRQQRFEQSGDAPSRSDMPIRTITPRTNLTGTTDPTGIVASDKITSGAAINGTGSDMVAMLGKTLADKNNLSVGGTFTAYNQAITIKAIYSTGNAFQDSGLIMPLLTVQTLTAQPGAVTSVTATVDSSDNVTGVVSALKTTLGDKADITSQQDQAENSLQPLESIASLALTGVIAAAIAGAAIILLSMIMIVRERRREIGVIKAIGGTNTKVIAQFMTEALTLTIMGGIIGLGLGVAVSGPMTQSLVTASSQSSTRPARGQGFAASRPGLRGIGTQLGSSVRTVTATLTPQLFAGSVGIILLIAVIGSVVPAWAIACVRPAEVLRTE